MSDFNEVQKGLPDLGKTYWQDIKERETDETPVADIVKINCQTIFNPEEKVKNIIKPSIFEK